MAVVKVALRQRETLALLRVRDKAIVLQTMLWPDEVREPEFETLRTEVELRPQEMQMATSLVESLSGDFESDQFEDDYRQADRSTSSTTSASTAVGVRRRSRPPPRRATT